MQKYRYYLEMFGNSKEEVEVPDNLLIELEGTDEVGHTLCYCLEYADYNGEYGLGVEGVHPDYLDPSEDGGAVEITFSRFREIAGKEFDKIPKEYLPKYEFKYAVCPQYDPLTGEEINGSSFDWRNLCFVLDDNPNTFIVFDLDFGLQMMSEEFTSGVVEITKSSFEQIAGEHYREPSEELVRLYCKELW